MRGERNTIARGAHRDPHLHFLLRRPPFVFTMTLSLQEYRYKLRFTLYSRSEQDRNNYPSTSTVRVVTTFAPASSLEQPPPPSPIYSPRCALHLFVSLLATSALASSLELVRSFAHVGHSCVRWRRGEEIIIIKIIKYVEYSVIESLRKKKRNTNRSTSSSS